MKFQEHALSFLVASARLIAHGVSADSSALLWAPENQEGSGENGGVLRTFSDAELSKRAEEEKNDDPVPTRKLNDEDVLVRPDIIGGSPVSPGQYPFFVQIEGPDVYDGVCGGSLIAKNLVITNPSCVNFGDVAPFSSVVIINSVNFQAEENPFSEIARIKSVVVHPNINQAGFDNYIAIIELTADVSNGNVGLVELAVPPYVPTSGMGLTAIGFGRTDRSIPGSNPSNLQETAVPYISDTDCDNIYTPFNLFFPYDVLICADANPFVGPDVCLGDHGGPLLDTSGPNPILVGVIAATSCTTAPLFPFLSFEVAGAEFQWIADTVCELASKIPEWAGPYCPSESPSEVPSGSPSVSQIPSQIPSLSPSQAPTDICYTCSHGSNPCARRHHWGSWHWGGGGRFYYPHCDPRKFVQCDEWGGCFEQPCAPGTVWDDRAYTCVHDNRKKKGGHHHGGHGHGHHHHNGHHGGWQGW